VFQPGPAGRDAANPITRKGVAMSHERAGQASGIFRLESPEREDA
jgi:hypothetical protein